MNTYENWSDIHGNADAFKAKILQIQDFASPRERSQVWAQNLRFLTPSDDCEFSVERGSEDLPEELTCDRCSNYRRFNLPDPTQQVVTRVRLTDPGELKGCDHYVAVSYCWPRKGAKPDDLKHTILTKSAEGSLVSRPAKAPKNVLDRAFAYASKYGIRLVWIDQECIDQDDRLDQEIGIQSMDLVYQRSNAPLGILQTNLDAQWQLNILDSLHQGNDLDFEKVEWAVSLLDLLSKDSWFTRAWILQESTSAGEYMDLIINYDSSLSADEYWGDIPGQIEFQWTDLNGLFDSATKQLFRHHISGAEDVVELNNDIVRKIEEENGADGILQKLDKFDILLEKLETVKQHLLLHTPSDEWTLRDQTYRIVCNAALANQFLVHCINSKPTDRIAILANMCQYPIRIDTTKVIEGVHDLSTSIFTQALINGDISLLTGIRAEAWAGRTVRGVGFSWLPPNETSLNPEEMETWLEGNQPFRLKDHRITDDGLSILGFLWKVDRKVDMTNLQKQYAKQFKELRDAQKTKYLDYIAWMETQAKILNPEEVHTSKILLEGNKRRKIIGERIDESASSTWDTSPEVMKKVSELSRWNDEPKFESMCVEILWAAMRMLLAEDLPELANAIWRSVCNKSRAFDATQLDDITARFADDEDRPETIDEWIEANIPFEDLPDSCIDIIMDEDPEKLIAARHFHPDSGRKNRAVQKVNPWFIERLLDTGHFYYGHLEAVETLDPPLAIFDVGGPCQILLPYSEGMEDFGLQWNGGLPAMRSKRISWIVSECVDDTDPKICDSSLARSFSSKSMVAGMWDLVGTKPKRYNLR